MRTSRKRRLYAVIVLVTGMTIAAVLVLYALRQNVDLYRTPTQVFDQKLPQHRTFRMGGMVEKESVQRAEQGLRVRFAVTDFTRTIRVEYDGILPALFREGQGIVVQGKLNNEGVFVASQVLAKHDEKYRPPHSAKNSVKKISLKNYDS